MSLDRSRVLYSNFYLWIWVYTFKYRGIMRIISKFSDYYDIGLAYGIDEKLRFERISKEVDEYISLSTLKMVSYQDQKKYQVTLFLNYIGFCEAFYPFVHIVIYEVYKKDKKSILKQMDENYYYDMGEIQRFIESYIDLESVVYDSWCYKYDRFEGIKGTLQRHFKATKNSRIDEIFHKYSVAYFVMDQEYNSVQSRWQDKVILYPQLKQYKFAKIKDPMKAFQELSMYLGNLHLKENEMVTIHDNDLAYAKGFDCYSFRHKPSKKKRKKC